MRLRSTTLSRRWVAGPGSIQARNFVNFYFCSDVIVSDKGRKLCFSSFIRLYAGLSQLFAFCLETMKGSVFRWTGSMLLCFGISLKEEYSHGRPVVSIRQSPKAIFLLQPSYFVHSYSFFN